MAADPQNNNKKTRGRQKIEMKTIENEDDKLVTFSKRRSGIYKKASELVTLTGTELAFVVYSPAGKPFSFAHPSIDAIANRFLGIQPPQSDPTYPLIEAHRLMRIEELNQQHNELIQQLDLEEGKSKQLKQKMSGLERKGWWDTPIEELNVEQLIEMEASYKNIQMNLINKLQVMTGGGASSSSAAVLPLADQPADRIINPFDFSSIDTASHHNYGYGPRQL